MNTSYLTDSLFSGNSTPDVTLPAAEPTTWAEACHVEPVLLHLETQTRCLGRSPRGRNRDVTWLRLKREFAWLAGWTIGTPAMWSSAVYETCYARLLAAFEGGRKEGRL